jgi:hypothetical protein
MLDEALLRPGRLEVHVEIGLPDEQGRLQILKVRRACRRCWRRGEQRLGVEGCRQGSRRHCSHSVPCLALGSQAGGPNMTAGAPPGPMAAQSCAQHPRLPVRGALLVRVRCRAAGARRAAFRGVLTRGPRLRPGALSRRRRCVRRPLPARAAALACFGSPRLKAPAGA